MRQRVEMCENGPFHHDALDGGGGDGPAVQRGRVCPILQHLFHQDGFGSFFEQDEEPEAHNVGDATWFQDRVQHAECSAYLCSDTLACVEAPNACPCPYREQQRCAVGDTHVCIQGQDCGRISSMYQLQ